jgi:hypothetical protein
MSLFAAPASAWAPARTALPGGGSIVVPRPYKLSAAADSPGTPAALVAFRNYRSTMAGTNESDGGLAVARSGAFPTLAEFVRVMRGAMTSRFANANESEGRWYGRPETFQETERDGPNGRERIGPLKVHVVGWTVYDAPGTMFAVDDLRRVMIGVWIFDKHGGEKRARRIADQIAGSFTA